MDQEEEQVDGTNWNVEGEVGDEGEVGNEHAYHWPGSVLWW